LSIPLLQICFDYSSVILLDYQPWPMNWKREATLLSSNLQNILNPRDKSTSRIKATLIFNNE